LALLIAAHGRPGLLVETELARLDHLAEQCAVPTLDGLVAHLFTDLGFGGDRGDYYDPRNSYLDEVLSRRRGIPITLSVLTMAVGRRLGVPLEGVGMPGHFLIRDKVDPSVFVDPFHHGEILDRDGCLRVFQAVQGPDATFDDSCLQTIGPNGIAARMLANLRNVFVGQGDRGSLTWVLRLRTLLPGSPAEEQVDLASALAAVGRFSDAASQYEGAADRLGGTLGQEYRRTAARLRARLN
jgi:regulator of sirC expression with transglutaminase-like and TPR domain